jgi:hypothetical protein
MTQDSHATIAPGAVLRTVRLLDVPAPQSAGA